MMASRKSTRVLALEFGPSTIRFVEMQVGGKTENQVVSAGIVALEAGDDVQTHADRIRGILAQSGNPAALIASLPLHHAFLRLVDVADDTADVPAALRWDMALYLARPLDWYALDFQPQGSRYLSAAYRLSEVETLRAALTLAEAPATTALDIDVLATLHVFTANYPECLGERTLIIKADALGTILFRTQQGEYLGGTVQRESTGTPLHTLASHERAEYLMHRARKIALGLGAALGRAPDGWVEAERIFLCGDLAADADFRELLKTGMQAPFALLNPFRKIPGPNPEKYPVAYPGAPFAATVGLALRAVAAREGGAVEPPRINLLRYLAAPQTKQASSEAVRAVGARSKGKRVSVALALLLLAVAVGVGLRNREWLSSRIPHQWVSTKLTPSVPDADSMQRALENEASQVVVSQQREAIAWLRETEAILPLGITLTGLTTTQADQHRFVIRGLSPNPESLSALQETLVLVPGLDLRRSEIRPFEKNRDKKHPAGTVEFLFSGSYATPQDTIHSSGTVPVANRVLTIAALKEEMQRFLEAATFAGIHFDKPAASTPTAAGAFRAIPYHLSALGTPSQLRAFLENEQRRESPFGIQRVLWENHPDSSMVFLDIMAFSR